MAVKPMNWLQDLDNVKDWRVVKLLLAIPDWEKRRDKIDWNRFLLAADGLTALGKDGNALSHTDTVIGTVDLIGQAFARAATNSTTGHSGALCGQGPNCPAAVDTAIGEKVTIKGAGQAVQLLGPAQAGAALAVDLLVALGVIPKDKAYSIKIIVGLFVHWQAKDNDDIFVNQFEGTFISILRALRILDRDETGNHPYYTDPAYDKLAG